MFVKKIASNDILFDFQRDGRYCVTLLEETFMVCVCVRVCFVFCFFFSTNLNPFAEAVLFTGHSTRRKPSVILRLDTYVSPLHFISTEYSLFDRRN